MPRPKLGRVCEKDGCGKPHKAKGLCANHHTTYRQKARREENKKVKAIYARDIDFDDYWLFVKKELGIK